MDRPSCTEQRVVDRINAHSLPAALSAAFHHPCNGINRLLDDGVVPFPR